MIWCHPLTDERDARLRKWREAQRRHRAGRTMTRERAIKLASRRNPKMAARLGEIHEARKRA